MESKELFSILSEKCPHKLLEAYAFVKAGDSVDTVYQRFCVSADRSPEKTRYVHNVGTQQAYYETLPIDQKLDFNYNDIAIQIKYVLGESLDNEELDYINSVYKQLVGGSE